MLDVIIYLYKDIIYYIELLYIVLDSFFEFKKLRTRI